MRLRIFGLVMLGIISCNKEPRHLEELEAFKSETECNRHYNTKTLLFEKFSIQVPCDWKIDTIYGIDTPPLQVIKTDVKGGIVWGWGSAYGGNSNYDHKRVLSTDLLDSMLTNYRDTSRYQFVNLRPNEIQQKVFYKFKDEYMVIDGLNAKITTMKSGYGEVEIHFESSHSKEIEESPYLREVMNTGLSISGTNLSRQTDSLLRQAFKTIKFTRE